MMKPSDMVMSKSPAGMSASRGEVMLHRRKLTLVHSRKGKHLGTVETYYVLGRKPAGGLVARVLILQDLHVKAGDVLVFDFTKEQASA